MRRISIILLAAVLVLTLASSPGAVVKYRVYQCSPQHKVIAFWRPAGPVQVGDEIRVKNETIDVIATYRYNTVLKFATLPMGDSTGFIAYYTAGDFATFCARCSGKHPLECVSDPLAQDPDTLSVSSCPECMHGPTLTQWGLLILVTLLVASAVYIMVRRRKASVPA